MSDWSDSSLDSQLLAAGRKRKGRALQSDSDSDASVSLEDEDSEEDELPSSKRKGPARPARKRTARGKANPGEETIPDAQDLIEDEEDEKRLAAMTELERELVLAERAEKKQQELQRQRLLAQAGEEEEEEEGEGKAQKGKAQKAGKGAKDVRSMRSQREVREEAAKKSAIQELKAARERKAKGEEARARKRDSEKDWEGSEEEEEEEAGSEELEAESMDEGEIDDDRGLGRRRGRRGSDDDEEDLEADEDAVRTITVGRSKLQEWVDKPFFESTLPGCMVRVGTGQMTVDPHTRTERQAYKLCQVVLVEARNPGLYKDSGQPWKSPYSIVPGGPKTDKWLLVGRGHSERFVPMAQISDKPFTEAEMDSYIQQCAQHNRPPVTIRQVEEVRKRLLAAESYRYTAEDVQRELEEKRAKGAAPRNAALEKARLQRERDGAREAGDEAAVAELEEKIKKLDRDIAASQANERTAKMAQLNKRNEEINLKNALNNVGSKVAGVRRQDSGKAQLDPFSRRATRSRVYWNTKKQAPEEEDLFGASDEDAGAQQHERGGSQPLSPRAAAAAAARAKGQQQQQQQEGASSEAAQLLRGLDLSLLDRPPKQSLVARKLLGTLSGWPRPAPASGDRPVVKLAEYRRSLGLA